MPPNIPSSSSSASNKDCIFEELLLGLVSSYKKIRKVKQWKKKSHEASISQLVNQSVSQPVNQSINQSINQWESVNQSVNQSMSQSINLSISESINHLVSWSFDHSINQSVSRHSVNNLSQDGPLINHSERKSVNQPITSIKIQNNF